MSKSYQQPSDRYKLAVGCNIFCIIKLQQLIRKQLIRGKLFYKLELNFVKLSRVNIGLDLILGRIVWFDLIWSYCESSNLHNMKKHQHFQIWYCFTQMVHFLLWIITRLGLQCQTPEKVKPLFLILFFLWHWFLGPLTP